MAWQGQPAAVVEDAIAWVGAQLARSDVQRLLRFAACLTLALWLARSFVLALWSAVPPAEPLPQGLRAINPALPSGVSAERRVVDLDAIIAAQLFGDATDSTSATDVVSPGLNEIEAEAALAGIEDGAPESRLPLILRGIVAATDAGLGQAVIEHSNVQNLYRVGDGLPVGDRVALAKVLPGQVVLDNGGRYELLRLFEEGSSIARGAPSAYRDAKSEPASSAPGTRMDANDIAVAYRERLYADPQSLTELVSLSVVRDGSQTIGYRLSPGAQREAFRALGFRNGDLVTAVNGKSVTELSNITSLYDDMRSADEAVFELSRGDEELTVIVDLGVGRR